MLKIVLIAVFITTLFYQMITKRKLAKGQISEEPLTTKEKILIWILCIFNPIWAGVVLYYGWKKRLPVKAKQANKISLWAFFLEFVLGVILILSGIL